MLRKLLAGLMIGLGAQLLLPPVFVGDFVGSRPVLAAELAEIRDRGHLIIGVKANRPPLGFIDEAGSLSGFEIDIARRLAHDLLGDETAVQFVPLSNLERLNAVLEGRVDLAIAAVTLTEPRRRIVHFSDPYYLDGTGFIVQPQTETLQDLMFSQVAVLNRSSAIAHVRHILPAAKLIGVESYQAGQALLGTGEVDAFAGDVSVLAGWTLGQSSHEEGDMSEFDMSEFNLLPNILSAEPLSIVTPKGRSYRHLQTAINQSIRRWYAEEWLQARAQFWSLPSGILPTLLESSSELEPSLETAPSLDLEPVGEP